MEEEKREQEGEWHHHQHHDQHHHHTVLGEGAETAQLLGFCDPGLTYLANTSGLGAATDRGHSSHHTRNIHTVSQRYREGGEEEFDVFCYSI